MYNARYRFLDPSLSHSGGHEATKKAEIGTKGYPFAGNGYSGVGLGRVRMFEASLCVDSCTATRAPPFSHTCYDMCERGINQVHHCASSKPQNKIFFFTLTTPIYSPIIVPYTNQTYRLRLLHSISLDDLFRIARSGSASCIGDFVWECFAGIMQCVEIFPLNLLFTP